MKQFFASLLLTLAVLAPSLAQAQLLPSAQARQPVMIDRIVAVADAEVVLQSELDDAVAQVQQQYADHPEQLPPQNVLQRQVLNRLILMKLQLQRAADQNVRVTNGEVDEAVNNVAQQNKLTPQQLQQAVEGRGMSFAAFRRQLGQQLTVQKLRDSVIHDQVTVTDAEVANLLSSAAFKAGEVHLAHIQISTPQGASADEIAKAAAKAERAEQAIKGGMDFNAAAIRFSDAPNALEGGDLGWRHMDEIPSAFTTVVAKMNTGDVSPPLRGPTGFHILKLVDQRGPGKTVITEFHARHILIKPSELVTEQQAEQKARDIYRQLSKDKADFVALAKKYSDDDTTANAGGDMGWFPQNAWGSALAVQLGQLQDGEVSKPFHVAVGWDIVQRLGTRQADKTKDNRRDQARQAIGNRKAEQAYEDYLRELRSSAYVNIRVPELRSPDDQASAGSASTP